LPISNDDSTVLDANDIDSSNSDGESSSSNDDSPVLNDYDIDSKSCRSMLVKGNGENGKGIGYDIAFYLFELGTDDRVSQCTL
jgi:hypothetical protein